MLVQSNAVEYAMFAIAQCSATYGTESYDSKMPDSTAPAHGYFTG
jgi:hypothetical protein